MWEMKSRLIKEVQATEFVSLPIGDYWNKNFGSSSNNFKIANLPRWEVAKEKESVRWGVAKKKESVTYIDYPQMDGDLKKFTFSEKISMYTKLNRDLRERIEVLTFYQVAEQLKRALGEN